MADTEKEKRKMTDIGKMLLPLQGTRYQPLVSLFYIVMWYPVVLFTALFLILWPFFENSIYSFSIYLAEFPNIIDFNSQFEDDVDHLKIITDQKTINKLFSYYVLIEYIVQICIILNIIISSLIIFTYKKELTLGYEKEYIASNSFFVFFITFIFFPRGYVFNDKYNVFLLASPSYGGIMFNAFFYAGSLMLFSATLFSFFNKCKKMFRHSDKSNFPDL